ncbi:YhfH family protein [Paenibacillus antri]|uniref:YhfH family protein n=1 Tax=Paenibacillus antri TaxID=2582848 RepID=A0A5R9G843_9BACL|nr:YhfH family protein [Paenibacillus antri]
MQQLSVVHFFDSLPPKLCRTCGEALHEQADCYWNHCFECMDLHVVPLSLSPRFAAKSSSAPV